MIQEPANALILSESKSINVDYGPWMPWIATGEQYWWLNNTYGPGPVWGGKKWEDKAFVVVFGDSHAKRTAMKATCGHDNEVNMWQYQRDKLATGYSVGGGVADLSWMDTFCKTLPF